jgi:hypothetical protein
MTCFVGTTETPGVQRSLSYGLGNGSNSTTYKNLKAVVSASLSPGTCAKATPHVQVDTGVITLSRKSKVGGVSANSRALMLVYALHS